jgi:leucyl aminopeptidase
MKINVAEGSITDIRCAALMVGIHEESKKLSGAAAAIDTATAGLIREVLAAGDFNGELYRTFPVFRPRHIGAQRLVLVGLGKEKEFTLDALRGAASHGARFMRDLGLLSFVLPGSFATIPDTSFADRVRAMGEGTYLGLYAFNEYKTGTNSKKKKSINEILLVVQSKAEFTHARAAVRSVEAIAGAVYLARDLVSRPANSATPSFMAQTARNIAKQYKLKCTVLNEKQARKLGMGCFLGVAQGSRQPARFIILEHVPKRVGAGGTIVLVGKAITFDSGGISLKPPKGMERMKDDMSGGAAVLGVLRAVAEQGLPLHVVGLVPATENLPDGSALKPGDIIHSMAGKTVEIISTDAEGRLVLADALTFAQRYKPSALIDLATLTGACVTALGTDVAGMMGTDEALMAKIRHASGRTGEKVWQLPLWKEYGELIKSDIADLKNVGGRDAGAITGGYFLKEFAGNVPWVHLDIAGPVWTDKDKPYIPKGATGFGVRLMLQLLEGWDKKS